MKRSRSLQRRDDKQKRQSASTPSRSKDEPGSRRKRRRSRSRSECISRLCSFWLRHGLKKLQEMGFNVTRFGEVAVGDLLSLDAFKKHGVTEADIYRVGRVFITSDGKVAAHQGHSDPIVQDDAYTELEMKEVPELAFHVCKRENAASIFRDGLRAGVDLGHRSNRRHVYLVSSLKEAKERACKKGGDRMEFIGVKLREAASKGAVVLRTSAGSLLVPSPGIDVSLLFRLEDGPSTEVSRTVSCVNTKMCLPDPPPPPDWLRQKRGSPSKSRSSTRREENLFLRENKAKDFFVPARSLPAASLAACAPPPPPPPPSAAAVAGGQVVSMTGAQPPVVVEGTHSKANSNIARPPSVAKASSMGQQPPSTEALPKQIFGTIDEVVAVSASTPIERLTPLEFNCKYNPLRTNTRQLSPGPGPVPSNWPTMFDPDLFLQYGHLQDVTELEIGHKRKDLFQRTIAKHLIIKFKALLAYMAT